MSVSLHSILIRGEHTARGKKFDRSICASLHEACIGFFSAENQMPTGGKFDVSPGLVAA